MPVQLPGQKAEFMSRSDDSVENAVLLYVKAGVDGISYGACPFCQSAILMLLTKAELTPVGYLIKTVDLRNPPAEFKQFSNKVPFLKYGETINITDMDEFLNFFDSIWPDHRIETKRPGASAAVRDLFSKFCFFIKGVVDNSGALMRELTKIDRYLANVKTPFIDGDSLTQVDCLLLPKLQHVRVAAKVYRNFEIPLELTNIWRYIHAGYSNKLFRMSCQSDQEIIQFWSEYPGVPRLPAAERKRYSGKAEPTYTLEVPDEVKPVEEAGNPINENADDQAADQLPVEGLTVSDDSAPAEADNPKIGSNEAKDEDRDSGNEEQSKEELEDGGHADLSGQTKCVNGDNSAPDIDVS